MVNRVIKPWLGVTLPNRAIEVSALYYDRVTRARSTRDAFYTGTVDLSFARILAVARAFNDVLTPPPGGTAITADQAIAHLEQAVQLEPDYADAHHNLGNAYLLSRRMPEAMREYEAALRLRPDDASARSGLEMARRAWRNSGGR